MVVVVGIIRKWSTRAAIRAIKGSAGETEEQKGELKRNLWNMVRFIDSFPDAKIVQTLSAQLIWPHFAIPWRNVCR